MTVNCEAGVIICSAVQEVGSMGETFTKRLPIRCSFGAERYQFTRQVISTSVKLLASNGWLRDSGVKAMRQFVVLVGSLMLVTLSGAAQTMPKTSLLAALPFASPFTSSSDQNSSLPLAPFAADLTSLAAASPSGSESVDSGLSSVSAPVATASPAPEPQYVQGVYQQYSWQAYLGYTFFRFYESSHPTIRENQNGANWSIVYYWKTWLGVDGEMSATRGSQGGQPSWFLFGGGGPRFRWEGPRGLELWAHALFGGSHFTPQTPFGKQEALAYEVGGGVDLHTPIERLGLRFCADMIGSRYFSTHQYSPKVSAGIVFKF